MNKGQLFLLNFLLVCAVSFAAVTLHLVRENRVLRARLAPSAAAAPRTTVAPTNAPIFVDHVEPNYQGYEGQVCVVFDTRFPLVASETNAPDVSPDIPFSFAVTDDRVIISAKFVPRTLYTFTFPAGWKNERGGTLERPAKISVRIPAPRPQAEFLGGGTYLPLKRRPLGLPFSAINVTNLVCSFARAYENNLGPQNWSGWKWQGLPLMPAASNLMSVCAPVDTRAFHMFDLSGLAKRPGVYQATLLNREDKTDDKTLDYEWVALTDLGVQTVYDAAHGAWAIVVNRLSDGAPVHGADVTVLSVKNQIFARGTTGLDGTVALEQAPAVDDPDDRPLAVFVRLADDLVYLPLENAGSRHLRNAAGRCGAPLAFVFMERGICRPGETFTASVLVRATAGGKSLRPLRNAPFTLTLRAPDGKTLATRAVCSDDRGFVAESFVTQSDWPSGLYTVRCGLSGEDWGSASIRVENYVPDRIRVELKRDEPADTSVSNALAYSASARYYFGAKVPEATWAFSVSAISVRRVPHHWTMPDAWTVGDPAAFAAGDRYADRGTLDDSDCQMTYPGFAAQGGKAFGPVLLIARATVQEPGGRGVTATRTDVLYPSAWFIGALRDESAASPAAERVRLAALAPDPARHLPLAAATNLVCALARVDWVPHYEADENGRRELRWKEELVPCPAAARVIPLAAGTDLAAWRGTWDIDASTLASGEYEVTVSCGPAIRTRARFWRNAGLATGRSRSPNVLTVTTDQESYRPGEVARLSFSLPVRSRAFLVGGERGLEWSRTAVLAQGTNTIAVAVPTTCLGSRYYVGVSCVADGPSDDPKRRFALAEVKVDQSAHRLAVDVQAPDVLRPGAEAVVTAAVTRAAGAVTDGFVRLMLVDEGVLALTDFPTPDPYAAFYGRAAGSPFAFDDLYGSIYPDLKILPNGQIGGDGLGALNLAAGTVKQGASVRLVLPPAPLAPDGKAIVRFTVPAHLGALRVMAVASAADAAGSGDRLVQVRDAASITVSAPRFAAAGDKADITFVVFNNDLSGTPRLTVDFKLPPALGDDAFKSELLLEKGRNSVITRHVAFRPDAAGMFTLRAALLADGRPIAAAESFLTVRPAVAPETRSVCRAIAPGEAWDSRAVAADWRGAYHGTCRVAGSPVVAVKDALTWLNDYPYGCLEQTTSRAFPFLALRELVALGVVDKTEADEVRSRVLSSAATRILAMSRHDGGFSMWPDEDDSWAAGTVYAAQFLFEAERRGAVKMDSDRRAGLIRFLGDLANDRAGTKRGLRSAAVFALALAGDESFLNPARQLLAVRTDDSAAFLAAAALVVGGYAQEGAAPLRAAFAARCWKQEDDSLLAFSTPASRLGMTLFVLARAGNTVPRAEQAALAAELAALVRPDGRAWGTTQANAWSSLGLAVFAAAEPAATNAAAPRTSDFSSAAPFAVTNTAASTLYLVARTTGIPAVAAPDRGGLKIVKRYLDAKGQPVTRVRHGDLLHVEISIMANRKVSNLVVSDLIPSCLEIEDGSLSTRESAALRCTHLDNVRHEVRDDRYVLFANMEETKALFTYTARATIRGDAAIPAATAEDMYDPDTHASSAAGTRLTVE